VRENDISMAWKSGTSSRVNPGEASSGCERDQPGKVIVQVDNRRPSREGIRTLLVGSDGGMVFAMLKQVSRRASMSAWLLPFPDKKSLDPDLAEFPERTASPSRNLVNMVRELAD